MTNTGCVPTGQVVAAVPPRPAPREPGPAANRWAQVGLAPAAGRSRELLGELAEVVRNWRARQVVEDFFFMHKPPGLRVRFAPAPGRASFVRAELIRLARAWYAAGLVASAESGEYEPEEHLFGGAESMAHVHRLFTEDATTWLACHAPPRPAPAWALSLAMLRPLFDALGLDARREGAVWTCVAGAGRAVPGGVGADEAADGIRRLWRDQDGLLAMLPDDLRGLATRHAERVTPLAAAWAGSLGPGEEAAAVAWYVVFHWNRAALTFGKQVLLTEALTTGGQGRGDVR